MKLKKNVDYFQANSEKIKRKTDIFGNFTLFFQQFEGFKYKYTRTHLHKETEGHLN